MYNYENMKSKIFTEEGQRDFLKVRDHVNYLLSEAGAFKMTNALEPVSGDGWLMIAYIDRMVELQEIREITNNDCVGQDRVFVKR